MLGFNGKELDNLRNEASTGLRFLVPSIFLLALGGRSNFWLGPLFPALWRIANSCIVLVLYSKVLSNPGSRCLPQSWLDLRKVFSPRPPSEGTPLKEQGAVQRLVVD